MKCKDRFHEIVRDEVEGGVDASWKEMMERSFSRMDKEVTDWDSGAGVSASNCRCELQTPQCDAVGSTAVVVVVAPDKVVVSNCGDSRAVLCRNGVAVPLTSDHKVRPYITKHDLRSSLNRHLFNLQFSMAHRSRSGSSALVLFPLVLRYFTRFFWFYFPSECDRLPELVSSFS